MTTAEVHYARNPRTHKHHRIVAVDGVTLTAEQCNADDSGEWEGESEERAAELIAEGESRCGHCWPETDE